MSGGFQRGPFQTNFQQEGPQDVVVPPTGVWRKNKKRKWKVVRLSDFDSRQAYEEALEAAAMPIARAYTIIEEYEEEDEIVVICCLVIFTRGLLH